MIIAKPIFKEDLLKAVLEHNFDKWAKGVTGWMFGYRISPINGKPQYHNGLDLGVILGTTLFAPWDGIVSSLFSDVHLGKKSLNGNMIKLTHPNDDQHPIDETLYLHLTGWNKSLRTGSQVKAGDIIGYTGNTGASTGPHLHFMTKILNPRTRQLEAVDPLQYLAASVGIAEIPTGKSGLAI